VAHDSSFAVWITGLPASGKSTLARSLVSRLHELGIDVAVLESDTLRKMFSGGPEYDETERSYFYESLAFIAGTLVQHGVSVVIDATANRRTYRDRARQRIPQFIEVYVECPLEICIQRDPKGIYRAALDGKAQFVPGLQVEYEPPPAPDLRVDGTSEVPRDAANRVIQVLTTKGFLDK
jgi:adenylylsulfate kinase